VYLSWYSLPHAKILSTGPWPPSVYILLGPCGIDNPWIEPSNLMVCHSKEVAAVSMVSDQHGDTDESITWTLGYVEEQAVSVLVLGMLFICRIKPLIFGDAETTIRSRSRDKDACRPRDYNTKNQKKYDSEH
jgi:hypothetical protein